MKCRRAKNNLPEALKFNKSILRKIFNFTLELSYQIGMSFMKTYKLLHLYVSLLLAASLCRSLTLLHLTYKNVLTMWSCVFTYQETHLVELLLSSSVKRPSYTGTCTYLSHLTCPQLFQTSHPFSVLSWNQFLCRIVYFLQPQLCGMTPAHSQQPTTYHSNTIQQ